jgi:hypothetical protein
MSIPNPLKGTYHIANNPDLYELQRQNNFELQVVFGKNELVMPNQDPQGEDVTYIDASLASEILRVSVRKDTVPNLELGVITQQHGNNSVKYVGKPTYGTKTMTCDEYIGRNAKYILQAWQHLCYDPHNQEVGLAKKYKKTAYLMEYTPDYSELVSTIVIYGCWPSNLTFTDDDNTAEGGKTMDCTLQYDYFLPLDINVTLK